MLYTLVLIMSLTGHTSIIADTRTYKDCVEAAQTHYKIYSPIRTDFHYSCQAKI